MVLLGLGTRYALASHWTLTTDVQATVSTRFIFDTYSGISAAKPGLGGTVGIRYAF